MKPLAVHIDWMDEFSNPPHVQILVDKMPDHKTLRWREKNGLYYAEQDGYTSHLYCKNLAAQDEGFGGRWFELDMEDGTHRTLKGPWSSRAECVNSTFGVQTLDIAIIDNPNDYLRGYTFWSGSVTLDFLMQALQYCVTQYPLILVMETPTPGPDLRSAIQSSLATRIYLEKTGKKEPAFILDVPSNPPVAIVRRWKGEKVSSWGGLNSEQVS